MIIINRRTALRSALSGLALTTALSAVPFAIGSAEARSARNEIFWDKYGIPHIYGRNTEDVVRGFCYAQTRNQAEVMLQNLAQARGRLAEYFGAGPGDANIQSDMRIRAFDIPRRAKQWLRDGGQEQRDLTAACANGINQYAATHLDDISANFRRVLPVMPEDILAGFQNTINFTFLPENVGTSELIDAWTQSGLAAAQAMLAKQSDDQTGSNGWALAPKKTVNGNAVLVGNPHLPYGANQPVPGLGVFQWVEAQLVIGDPEKPKLNATGVTFPGSAFIGIGYTDDIGWTHTNNTIKNADLYEITLTGPDTYLFEGKPRKFKKRTDTIKVRQDDGSFATQSFPILETVQGPLITPPINGKALALRVAGLDAPSPVSQYWGMIRAKNLKQFIKANSALQMPFFNVIYADRNGEIMYLFGGRQPVRSGGSYEDWAGILPGDKKSALWTDTFPWSALPKTINPPSGFVQNSNDPPWTSTFPQTINPAFYPSYVAPQVMYFRPQNGANFLLSKPKFTLDEILAGKMSVHAVMADRLLPDLLAAANASGDADVLAGAAILAGWDREFNANSIGAVLFQRWYQTYLANPNTPRSGAWGTDYPAFRIEWSTATPLTTPVGLADTTGAVAALGQAVKQLNQTYGTAGVPYGVINRLVLGTFDPNTFTSFQPAVNDPLSAASGFWGPLRVSGPFPLGGGAFGTAGGDGYVQLVEFTPEGAKARALITYGNSSRRKDAATTIPPQSAVFAQKQLREVYRSRAEVEANAVRYETY